NNLLSGGSFDNANAGSTWRAASSIPGWNDSGVVEVWGPGFVNTVIPGRNEGAERGVVVELDYGNNNIDWIEQNIETNDGSQYLVFIDALSRIGRGASDDFELQWNNNTFLAATTSEMSGQGWQTFGGLVVGTGASDTLRISETAAGNDGVGPVIDNVRLYRYEPETPSVDEHTPGGTEVTHILVSMRDGTSHSNLRLTEDGGGRFALDAESGLITTTRSLDYESDPTSYRLTIAVDTDEGTHLQYLTVNLNETNQAPTAVDLVNQVSSISEAADTSSPVRVADIQITDDGAGTNVVSLAGSDADQFEVIGDSLYLRADRLLDYETQSSYSVTVNVIDPAIGSPITTEAVLSVDELGDILDSLTSAWDQNDLANESQSESALWSEWDEIDLLFD
ncbi:MAG: cadherin domain-containing protein, partial [Planctomycetota bacterium]|nr:cadherin domain-containing protein [Planctomycetota bacterium]